MTTLGSRIKEVITYHRTTMTQFAKDLNISQSMVSKICGDKATPSDRTITDICRIYTIRREWLTNGTGEMIDLSKREERISELFDENNPAASDYFKQTMTFFLARMSAEELEGLIYVYDQFRQEAESNPEKKAYSDIVADAFMKGFRAAQSIYEQYGSLPKIPDGIVPKLDTTP